MSQQDLTANADDVPEDLLNEPGAFGETEPVDKSPFWKRELLFGYSLPWLLGGLLSLALAAWYLFGQPLSSSLSQTPAVAQFQDINNRIQPSHTPSQPAVNGNDIAFGTGAVSPGPDANAVVPPTETANLMTEIRNELNERDKVFNASLASLQTGINKLADAIKRDEAFAIESRNQLIALQSQLASLESRMSSGNNAQGKTSAGKQNVSNPVSGMKVMSLENGMAWILWQGSTWAVREGDSLGKVTIRHIDPATRSVVTSGGTLH